MIDAEKREKVISGLEYCLDVFKPSGGYCSKECPYYSDSQCYTTIKRDALVLLKEQEPRVMTLKEVEKNEEWMWVEYVSGYCGWQRPDKEDDYLNMVAWNDATFDRKDYYGKTWRCWSARPSPEQMRDTPWEEKK